MTADIFVWLVVHVRVCVFIMSVYCVCVICPYTPSHSVLSLLFFFFFWCRRQMSTLIIFTDNPVTGN